MYQSFQVVHEHQVKDGPKITKYRSKDTKLSVCFIDNEGPLMNGFFLISTESFDDDGCPHTLEHLVFLGSEDYPYKGVLDRLANRCLADGTNAWTDTDHVAFTISTAGSEGFLNILPIYLDHILFCTLTDSGFHTEVYHITGEGKDAGVVYSEMQGRENTSSDRLHHELLSTVFPGQCGYNAETGGKMKNLRELTIEKIRNYHSDYFRPENICLLISGKIDHQKVFQSLERIEKKILNRPQRNDFKRPWVTSPIPPFKESVTKVVEFPDESETIGEVLIGMKGPHYNEFEQRADRKSVV